MSNGWETESSGTSLADLIQTISAWGNVGKEARQRKEREHKDYLNQFSLYEGLIKSSSGSQELLKLQPSLNRLDSINNEFDDLNDLDIYLQNSFNKKLDIAKKSEDAYVAMTNRANKHTTMTDDDIQTMIMGNPVEGVDGMNIVELTDYRDKLLTDKLSLEEGKANQISFGSGMSPDFLIKKYDDFLGQTEAAMLILKHNQHAFKDFKSLDIEDRKALEAMHENLIVSVYAGDKQATGALITNAKTIFTNQYSKASKEADVWRNIFERFYQETGAESQDLTDEFVKSLEGLFGEGFEASDLYGKIQNQGALTKEQVINHFQNSSKEAQAANLMFKTYTGGYIAEDYSPLDIDEAFADALLGITPREKVKNKAKQKRKKDDFINNVTTVTTEPTLRDPKIFEQFFLQKERGGRTSNTIKRLREEYDLSHDEIMDIIREQEQTYAKEKGYALGQYRKKRDGSYEWIVPGEQKGQRPGGRAIDISPPEEEVLLTKPVKSAKDSEELKESRKYSLGLANPDMFNDKEFIKEFSSDVTGQNSIDEYLGGITSDEVLSSFKGKPEESQKIIDELFDYADNMSKRINKLRNAPEIKREHVESLIHQIRTAAYEYINITHPITGVDAYNLAVNEKFRNALLIQLEEKLSKINLPKTLTTPK